MRKVLVIGYGNTVRGDDAAGIHAAHRLEESFRDCPEVRIIAAHQLTPELAEDVSGARYVLFLDAAPTGTPGEISQRRLAAGGVLGAWGDNVTPGALLLYAEQLYGEAPPALCLTIAGESFAPGAGMSASVRRRMEEFVMRAAGLIESWLGDRLPEERLHTTIQ